MAILIFSMLGQKERWIPALKNKIGVLVILKLLERFIPPFIYYYFWRTVYRKVLQTYTLVKYR